jgi:hypothetical protein
MYAFTIYVMQTTLSLCGLAKANSQRKENAWPFLGRREKNLFFSTSYFHFLPCPIKLREKNTFSSLPFILRRQKKRLPL